MNVFSAIGDGPPARSLALTFDDGPDRRWTPRVLAALAAADSEATFFVTPRLGLDVIERVAAAGHEVGYHCGRHIRHTDRRRAEVAAEVERDLTSLAAIGITVEAWRPPWGVRAQWTGELAAEMGLRIELWTCDTEDWRGRSAPEMLAGLVPELENRSVVLMHDGIGPGALRDGVGETTALLGPLVDLARSRGLKPATISAMRSGEKHPAVPN